MTQSPRPCLITFTLVGNQSLTGNWKLQVSHDFMKLIENLLVNDSYLLTWVNYQIRVHNIDREMLIVQMLNLVIYRFVLVFIKRMKFHGFEENTSKKKSYYLRDQNYCRV